MTSKVKSVLFSDGEEVALVDLQRVIRGRKVLEGDMRLGAQLAELNPGDFLDPYPNAGLYATVYGGAPYAGAGARQVGNVGGLIHQYTGFAVPDDAAPVLLSYWLASDEMLTTLAVGDATNPRIDLIQVKLDVDQMPDEDRDFEDATTGEVTTTSGPREDVVRLTKSVKAGTPGATPTPPSADAGYVPWCYVWVPATYNAPFGEIEITDLRYPLGYSRPTLPASAGVQGASFTNWPLQNAAGFPRLSGGAGHTLYFNVPTTNPASRLLAIHAHADANVDMNLYLVNSHTGSTTQIAAGTNIRSFSPGAPLGPTTPGAWWTTWTGSHAMPTLYGQEGQYILQLQVVARGAGTNLYGVSFELTGTL